MTLKQKLPKDTMTTNDQNGNTESESDDRTISLNQFTPKRQKELAYHGIEPRTFRLGIISTGFGY
jgi:hypothetical protein